MTNRTAKQKWDLEVGACGLGFGVCLDQLGQLEQLEQLKLT